MSECACMQAPGPVVHTHADGITSEVCTGPHRHAACICRGLGVLFTCSAARYARLAAMRACRANSSAVSTCTAVGWVVW